MEYGKQRCIYYVLFEFDYVCCLVVLYLRYARYVRYVCPIDTLSLGLRHIILFMGWQIELVIEILDRIALLLDSCPLLLNWRYLRKTMWLALNTSMRLMDRFYGCLGLC